MSYLPAERGEALRQHLSHSPVEIEARAASTIRVPRSWLISGGVLGFAVIVGLSRLAGLGAPQVRAQSPQTTGNGLIECHIDKPGISYDAETGVGTTANGDIFYARGFENWVESYSNDRMLVGAAQPVPDAVFFQVFPDCAIAARLRDRSHPDGGVLVSPESVYRQAQR